MPSPDQSLPLTSMLPNLLLLIAVAAGIVVTEPSLSTDRVLRPETATRSENEKTGVRSSFWEDPLAISPGGQKASMPELSSAPLIPDERYLDERIKDKGRLDLANDRLLVLFVGLDGGGDPVAKERRIRTRVAVASALTGRASMLVNSAQEQLKPCFIPLVDSVQGAAMEIFEGLNFTDSRWFSVGRGKVNVVYLDENSIRPSPANMEQLVKASGQQGNPNCRFSYIGLCRSERLWSFLSSAIKKPPIAEQTLPSSIEVYSPYATAEDDMIWKHISPKTKTVASEKIRLPKGDTFVSNSYAFGNDSFRGALHRVGADDGDLARALIAELNVRGITSGSGGQEKQSGETTKDAVLILADMDRYHSRVLANSFSRAWQERYEVDRNADEKGKYILSEKLSQEVRVIHYTEALDGMLAAAKENPASKPENSVKQLINPGGKYAAEGTSQIDALRRFPARLHELEKANGVRYRAIGLLGSDVHDKLLLLKALKPSFPNSVFFTNDLDARLWQGEGRNASINLIVAGAFGLTLNSQLQGNVMPFRSSYQTATYLACLHAIDFKKRKDEPENPNRHYSDIQWPKAEVELHEVKRSGDHLLSYWGKSGNSPPGMLTKVSGRTSLADREATTAPLFRGIFQMLILIVLGILFFQIWWLMRADPDVKSPKRGLLISRIVVTLIVIICGAAALYMQTFADRDGAAGEIRELFSGVSAIPVASANCLIIAIGSVMVLRLFHARRPRPPYPFAQKEGATLAVENLTSEVNDPGALVQCWQLPSPRDLAGWISALCKWCGHSSVCKKYNEPRGSMADFLKNHEIQRRAEVLERLPEGRLVSTYASELLATNPLNIWIRIVLFILIGFVLYWQLKEDVPIPPSVRGTFFRSVFEWSDGLAKFMLALVANAALDRQISMAIGLDKFCEFLRRHTGGDHNTAPYAWIDRPDIAKDEWERHDSNIRQPNSGDVGLWEMPLLRLASQRFLEISPLMVMPFILLFLMLVSRREVFENLSIPIPEIILFSFFLLAPLAAGALAQLNMGRAFDLVSDRLRRGARYVPDDNTSPAPAKIRKAFFDNEIELCKDLESRTRYGILLNPLVKAILLPLGGVGLLELSSHAASLLK